jgi:hypothetical protein
VSTLIKKSAKLFRRNLLILLCTLAGIYLVWRGLTYDHGVGDMLTSVMCIALALCLVLTAIAADEPPTSEPDRT